MIDLDQVDEYENFRTKDFAGFAEFFLQGLSQKSQSDDEIDTEVYAKLIELDTRLGTTATEQLIGCIAGTTRCDIIKVWIFCDKKLNVIQDD